MDIPEDVLAMADKARIYDRSDYQVIAEWARKQTLLDAVDAIEGIVVMPVGDHVGYYEAGLEEATDAVRALGESR